MFVGHVVLIHLFVNCPLLKVDIHSRSVKNRPRENAHATDQRHHVLLACMEYLYPLIVFKQFFDFCANQFIKVWLFRLDFPDINNKYVFSLVYAAYLDEIYVSFLCQLPLQVHTVFEARTKDQAAVLEALQFIHHHYLL